MNWPWLPWAQSSLGRPVLGRVHQSYWKVGRGRCRCRPWWTRPPNPAAARSPPASSLLAGSWPGCAATRPSVGATGDWDESQYPTWSTRPIRAQVAASAVEAAPEPAQALLDVGGGDGPVAEDDAGLAGGADVVHRQGLELHAGRRGPAQHGLELLGGRGGGGRGDVQPGRRGDRLQLVGEPAVQRLHDLLVSLLVDRAHLAQVAGEQALVDEVGQGALEGQRGVPVGQELGAADRRDQGRRRDQEPRRRVASRVLENEPT